MNLQTTDLGKLGRDKVSGFEGIVTSIVKFIYEDDIYYLTPNKLIKGKFVKAERFEVGGIEIIGEGIATTEVKEDRLGGDNLFFSMAENFGKLGRDKITGFEGIITAIVKNLHGEDRYGLHPLTKSGKLKKPKLIHILGFANERIEIIGEGVRTSEVHLNKLGAVDLPPSLK